MSFKHSVFISLCSTELRGMRCSGDSHTVERVLLEPDQWEKALTDGLRTLDEPLQRLVARLGCGSGVSAVLLYHVNTTVVDVHAVPTVGAPAIDAARLAMIDTMPDIASADVRFMILSSTRGGTGASGTGTSGAAAQSHVLTIAESERTTRMLGAWMTRGGLRATSLVPVSGHAAADAIGASRSLPGDGLRASLWLGEHSTVISCMRGQQLEFLRVVAFGVSQLTEAMYRAGRGRAEGGRFDRAVAQTLLMTIGLPRRGHVVDAQNNITAEDVLPLMQSALQRYIVETRQTLRFGISDEELSRTTLYLFGTGATIPGLADALGSSLELAVEVATQDGLAAGDAGDLESVRRLDSPEVCFSPPAERERREKKRLIGAAAAGLVIAAGLIGGDAWLASKKLRSTNAMLTELEPQSRRMQDASEKREQVRVVAGLVGVAERQLDEVIGKRASWAATLAFLTHASQGLVRLDEVHAEHDMGTPQLTLRGIVYGPDSETDQLALYVSRLTESALVESAKISSMRADTESTARFFTVTVRLRSARSGLQQASAGGAS